MVRDRGTRPTHYVAVTAKIGKGKYEKGPYIGLWEGDGERNSPLFRGSASGKYLDELADFIKDFGEDSIGFAIFESRNDKNSRNRNEDDEDRPPRGRRSSSRSSRDDSDNDRDGRSERGGSRRRGSKRDDDRDEKEDRGGRESSRGSSKGKKGDDWWQD